jgi:prepilin-type N-terminal cleavage/methylation domain-containing protein
MTRAAPRRQFRRLTGFTLIEVLVTIALVGITFPAIMAGVTLALHAAADARKKEEASGLAEQKLNEMIESEGSGSGASANSGDFGPEHEGFTWRADISNVDTDLDQVSVRVSWTSRGRERGIDLSGYAYTGTGPSTSGTLGTSSTGGSRQ